MTDYVEGFFKLKYDLAKLDLFEFGQGLSKNEYFILAHLIHLSKESNQPLTLGRLASDFQVSPPGMSRTVKCMVDKGLLIRQEDQEDRRVTYISVTQAGIQAWQETLNQIKKVMEGYLSQFSQAELDTFFDIGYRLIEMVAAKDNEKKKGE